MRKSYLGLVALALVFAVLVNQDRVNDTNIELLKEANRALVQYKAEGSKREKDLLTDIQKLTDEVDTLNKEVESLRDRLNEVSTYRSSISKAIMETSVFASQKEADMLAKTIDLAMQELKQKYGYEPNVNKVLAIISAESDFRNLEPNRHGATGYMQVSPPALEDICEEWGTDPKDYDLKDPFTNIYLGTYYVYRDIAKLGNDKAIVAYNQGYRNLSRAVSYSRGVSNSYLNKVLKRKERYKEKLGG